MSKGRLARSVFMYTLIFWTAAVTLPAAGEAGELCHVDLERILTGSEAGRRASARFEKSFAEKQERLDAKQREVGRRLEDFQQKESQMEPHVATAEREDIEKQMLDLQTAVAKLDSELNRERTELIRDVLKKATPAIAEVAGRHGCKVVLDNAAIVWKGSTRDITGDVSASQALK